MDLFYTSLANIPNMHSDPILSSTPWSSKWSLHFWLSHQNLVQFTLSSHACHMSRPPHSPWFDLPNNIRGWVRNMKLLIVQLPSLSCYFIPLWSKHSPYNPVFKHLQSKFLPYCERPSFTSVQNNWQNYGFVYFSLYIPIQQAGRQKTLDRMVASIPRI
jgi:hypothetical protein